MNTYFDFVNGVDKPGATSDKTIVDGQLKPQQAHAAHAPTATRPPRPASPFPTPCASRWRLRPLPVFSRAKAARSCPPTGLATHRLVVRARAGGGGAAVRALSRAAPSDARAPGGGCALCVCVHGRAGPQVQGARRRADQRHLWAAARLVRLPGAGGPERLGRAARIAAAHRPH
eukprot:4206159-Prymnesium_polylepis.1